MKRSWHFPFALLTGLGCSVYSADLLREQPDSIAEAGTAGSSPDSGTPDSSTTGGSGGGAGASAGTTSAGGSDAGGGGGGASGSGGQGGCIGLGGAGGEDLDCCPDDPDKVDPGACGCGIADADGDTDGTVDCLDGCPSDGAKTSPGSCGCGYVDASCDELQTAMIHRYSFTGTGTEATDSIGAAHGTVIGGTLGGGSVTLAGLQSDQHVDLPDGMISVLTDATFEIWSSWSGGSQWQRLFDFGDQRTTTSGSVLGRTYLFLTPLNQQSVGRAVYKQADASEVVVNDTALFPAVVQSHAAVVVDDTNDQISLYVQGQLKGSAAFPDSLSLINDVNNWLGRSNYEVDPDFSGSISEFRIYDVALGETQIALSFELGPDPMFLAE